MQLNTVTVLALVAGAFGLPPSALQGSGQRDITSDLALDSKSPCGNLMRKAVCCRKSFLGIDIGCHRASPGILTGPELEAECEAKDKLPRCCIMGILGIYGPCKPPKSVAKELGYFNDTEPAFKLSS